MNRALSFLLTPLIFCLGSLSAYGDDYSLNLENTPTLSKRQSRLVINNRPLAKVNGKVISLFDVVKKLDLFLYDYDPEYIPSVEEKYQFYQARWQFTLDDMIIEELVLLDAEKKEIEVSEGEIRQEMINRFGPNIMLNLERVSLSYDEAKRLIKRELLCNRLVGMNVHARAFQQVTPEKIQQAYTTYLEEHPPKEHFVYQILSIRSSDKALADKLGGEAQLMLSDEKASLETVQTTLTDKYPGVSISVSQEFERQSKELSAQYKSILTSMDEASYSKPCSQFSRHTKSQVCRIFHLIRMEKEANKTFNDMHETLKQELLNQAFEVEKQSYDEKLEKRYGFFKATAKFDLPKNYHPFFLL